MLMTLEQRTRLEYELTHGDKTRMLQEVANAVGTTKGQIYHELQKTVGLGRDWTLYNAKRAQTAFERRQKNSAHTCKCSLKTIPTFQEQSVQHTSNTVKKILVKGGLYKTPQLTEGVATSVWQRIRGIIFKP